LLTVISTIFLDPFFIGHGIYNYIRKRKLKNESLWEQYWNNLI